MSTHCDIIVKQSDGEWIRAYCHFDGYLEGVGKALLTHFNNHSAIFDVLINGEDISAIKADGSIRRNEYSSHFADSLVNAAEANALNEYTYIWDGECWYYKTPWIFIMRPLSEAVGLAA